MLKNAMADIFHIMKVKYKVVHIEELCYNWMVKVM